MFELIPELNADQRLFDYLEKHPDFEGRTIFLKHDFVCAGCGFSPYIDMGKFYQGATEKMIMAFEETTGYLSLYLEDVQQPGESTAENKAEWHLLCAVCRQTVNLLESAKQDAFSVIEFPYLSQGDLNLLINLTFVLSEIDCNDESLSSEDRDFVQKSQDEASNLLVWLDSFQMQAINRLGAVEKPVNFANALKRLQKERPDLYALRKDILGGIRILPTGYGIDSAFSYWGKLNLSSWIPVQQWKVIYDEVRLKIAG